MAFDISGLTLMAHGNGRNVYYYTNDSDTLATIRASGYFGQDSTTGQQAANMVSAGDVIIASGSDGVQILRVDTVSGNTVTTEMGAGETAYLTVPIAVASSSGGLFVPAPFDGNLIRAKLATNGETLTPAVFTFTVNGSVAGTITLDQSGQPAGEVYEVTFTTNQAFSEGDAIQITWDGGVSSEMQSAEADCIIILECVPA